MPDSVGEAIVRARETMAVLRALGEEIADEWQYVVDLETGWNARLDAVATARGGEPLSPSASGAVDRAAAEARLIVDPHRAIDWLSTFPQVVLLALDEPA